MYELSVIIVAYNEVEYIGNAIESVLSQCGSIDYEIIVGDDGSSDGTYEIIEEYKNKFPDVIRTFIVDRNDVKDSVVASARVSNVIKQGLLIASGKYFCIIAGDDYYNNNYFFVNSIELLERHPNYIGVVSNYGKIWDDGKFELQIPFIGYNNDISSKDYIQRCIYSHVSSFIFRNIFLESVEMLDGLSFIDDIGLSLLIASKGNFVYLDEMSFCYRQRDRSITYSIDINEVMLSQIIMYLELFSVLQNKKLWFCSRLYIPIVKLMATEDLNDDKYDKYFEIGQKNKYFNWLCLRKKKSVFELFRLKMIVFFCGVIKSIDVRAV